MGYLKDIKVVVANVVGNHHSILVRVPIAVVWLEDVDAATTRPGLFESLELTGVFELIDEFRSVLMERCQKVLVVPKLLQKHVHVCGGISVAGIQGLKKSIGHLAND